MGLPVNDPYLLFQAQEVSGMAAIQPSVLPTSINIARYTEDLTWPYYAQGNSAVKSGELKPALVDGRTVMLGRVTSANFYAVVRVAYSAAGLTPFTAGHRYLISHYIWSPKDFWFLNRTAGGSDYGHGVIWVRARELTRVWSVAVAVSATSLDLGFNPLTLLGAGATNDPILYAQSANPDAHADVWIGGLMIEGISSTYNDGLAVIGDSRFAGSSGGKDLFRNFNDPSNREVTTILGSELRINVFNRAIGGHKLSDMDTRWSADITPLKHRCHAALIQGGVNDIANGATLAQVQTSVMSMTNKANVDGFAKTYYVTDAPGSGLTLAQRNVQNQFNTWLLSTFGSAVSDIATFLTDPITKDLKAGAYGDGIHYGGAAKTAIAAYMVKTLDWSWRVAPSPYVKVCT